MWLPSVQQYSGGNWDSTICTVRMGEEVAGTPLSEPGALLQAVIALPLISSEAQTLQDLVRGRRLSSSSTLLFEV